jgi:hypothetical protein
MSTERDARTETPLGRRARDRAREAIDREIIVVGVVVGEQ